MSIHSRTNSDAALLGAAPERLALSDLWTWLLHNTVEFTGRKVASYDVATSETAEELVLSIRKVRA